MTDTDSSHDDLAGRAFRDRLDMATRHALDLPTPAARIAHGRRALRRRRATQAVAGLVAVAVIGSGAAWAVAGTVTDTAVDTAGQDPRASADPCPTLPTGTDPTTTRIRLPAGDQQPVRRVDVDLATSPVDYGFDGEILANRGYRVRQHLEGEDNTERTGWDAVEVEGSNGRFFRLMAYGNYGGGGSATLYYPVTPRRASLQQWLTYHFEVKPGRPADLVDVTDDGTVAGHDGVEVLEQRTADLPLVDRRSTSTVARVRQDGDECYVIPRAPSPEGPPRSTSSHPSTPATASTTWSPPRA